MLSSMPGAVSLSKPPQPKPLTASSTLAARTLAPAPAPMPTSGGVSAVPHAPPATATPEQARSAALFTASGNASANSIAHDRAASGATAASWQDPATGAQYEFGGGAGGGSRASSAGAGPDTGGGIDDFDSVMARLQQYLPKPVPRVDTPTPEDRSGLEAAAFARAKDRAALSARSATDSLHELMASNGLSGSSIEGQGLAGVINNANQQTGEVSRDQAIQSATRAGQVADRDYSGAITQRGQDEAAANSRIANISTLYSLLRRSRTPLY